jgi:DNA-binding transcriptional LysR family regulator
MGRRAKLVIGAWLSAQRVYRIVCMKSDLETIAVFVRVVEEKSFTAAGKALGVGPSAVSKKVARLENQLGVSLLNRTTRKLVLTNAGQELFERCLKVLTEMSEAEEAVQSLRKVPHGLMRVKVPQGFGPLHITPLIPKFLSSYPELKIDLTFGHWDKDAMEEQVDVIIASADPPNHNLASRTLMHFERVTCASPAYIRRNGKPKEHKDLAEHNCLIFADSPSTAPEWVYYTRDGVKRVRVSGNFRTNDSDAVYCAVLGGLGIAHMPAYVVADALVDGRLETIFRDSSSNGRYGAAMKVYYPPAKHRLPKIKAFIDFLVKSLRAGHDQHPHKLLG